MTNTNVADFEERASSVIKFSSMQGINYVVDGQGNRVAVQIDLEKHGSAWEDFYDLLIAETWATEPREPIDHVSRMVHGRRPAID